MSKRRTLTVLAVAVAAVVGAGALAQQAAGGTDLNQRIVELTQRAQRLTQLAGVPAEAKAQAEALLERYEALRTARQELAVARLEALVAALEAGEPPTVARELADAAVADRRVEVTRQQEELQADVEALVEQYPDAAALFRGLGLEGATLRASPGVVRFHLGGPAGGQGTFMFRRAPDGRVR